MTSEENPIFAAYCEIQDAGDAMSAAPVAKEVSAAAAIEIAKVLTRFDGQIDDEWRHALIVTAGGLLRLAGIGKLNDHG